jgi:hypothetical protein
VPANVVTRLRAIDFGRGSEALYRDQMPGLLTELADRARVLSIAASSAIEGVIVADADRAQRIINRAGRQPPSAVAFHCGLRSRSISSGGRTPTVRIPASMTSA